MKNRACMLDDAMKQVLEDMRGSTQELDTVIEQVLQDPIMSEDGKDGGIALLHKPLWKLTVRNQVEGTVGGTLLSFDGTFIFSIDTTTLIERVDKIADQGVTALKQIQQLGNSNKINEELMAVMLDSLYPRTWGKLIEFERHDAKKPAEKKPPIQGKVELVFREGLVYVQWAEVLADALPHPYFVAEASFDKACWIPFTVLTGKSSFKKQVAFEDLSNGEPVQVTAEMTFAPIKK